MKPRFKTVPVNSPREFLISELFFSTTNQKGIIVSGNDVFSRVSGYPAEEMVGRPHNMIRHPDMPRAVFALLWDYLLAGKPIAAYVKNMAADGRYYWVLALAAPIDGGYLSVRFKPSSPLFAIVTDIYARLREVEQAHDDRGEEPKAGMRAAEAMLGDILRGKGFADYDAFMRTMLHQELKSRDSILAREHRSMFPPLPPRHADEGPLGAALRVMYQESQQTYGRINSVYAQLDECARLNEQLMAQSSTILGLTSEFRLVSFNVAVKSSKLGDTGRALSVIATQLGDASSRVATSVSGLTSQVAAVSNWLGETVFSLAWARLQFEMTIVYHHEILTALSDPGRDMALSAHLSRLGDLRCAFCETIAHAGQSLRGLAAELSGLNADVGDLRKAMLSLQVTHVGGLVEARRLTEDDSFSAIFEDVRRHIDGTKAELVAFSDVIQGLGALARQAPQIMSTVSSAADQMRRGEEDLGNMVNQIGVAPLAATGTYGTFQGWDTNR